MDNQGASHGEAGRLPDEFVEILAAEIAIPVPPERLRAALTQHAGTYEDLMRVRSIRLEYSPDYVEPLTALRWIERGGNSVA